MGIIKYINMWHPPPPFRFNFTYLVINILIKKYLTDENPS